MPVVIYNNTERSPLIVLLVLLLMSIIYASVFLHVATSVNRKLIIYLSMFIKLFDCYLNLTTYQLRELHLYILTQEGLSKN